MEQLLESYDQKSDNEEEFTKEQNNIDPKCEICMIEKYKYRCPACEVIFGIWLIVKIRTCSIQCCQQHKQDLGCSGSRSKTNYIDLSEFSENTLLNGMCTGELVNSHSDYRFLEEVNRLSDNAKRGLGKVPSFCNMNELPRRLQFLAMNARQKGVFFRFMPPMMSKRKNNTSYYDTT